MTTAQRFHVRPFLFLLALLMSGFLVHPGQAQSTQYTTNTADSNLRGSLQVDPSTLGMSFNLPLGAYGGRAATLPISLTYSSKAWRVEHTFGYDGPLYYINETQARYGEKSVAGWTGSTQVPYIEFEGSYQPYDATGNTICLTCDPTPDGPYYYLNRALVHLPDGSAHEVRKNDTVEGPFWPWEWSPTFDGVYVAVDGSRIKYDTSTSTIYLPDGSRYWLTAPNGVQYIDRNGNTLTYNSTNKQWTDTLGRTIDALSKLALNNSTTGDKEHLLPGVGGVNQKFILRWRNLSDTGVLTVAAPLRFKGDRKPGQWSVPVSPSLFTTTDWSQRIVASGVPGSEFNPVVLHEIVLPSPTGNEIKYKFTYNVWGEVDKVVLPSGGYERFEYAKVPSISDVDGPYAEANRGVIKHWISATGNSADEVLWTYASTGTTTTVTNPSGARAERSLHAANGVTYYGFEDARAGRAYEERTYNASSQMIRRTLTEWTQDGPLPGGHSTATRNPRPTKTVEILLDTTGDALAKTTTTQYDADLNATVTNQYEFVTVDQYTAQNATINSIAQGSLVRTEEMTYLVNDLTIPQYIRDAYRARHLLSLLTNSKVKNASGTVVAESQTLYDEAVYPLLTYASVLGWSNPATPVRGNTTTTKDWNNTNDSWIETHIQYDQCGNIRKTWDGKNNLSEMEYSDSFSNGVNYNSYAYPTKTISPAPDPSGTYGSTSSLIVESKYDYHTGEPTWIKDANNQITTTEYETGNSLNRIIRVVRPGGGETVYEYSDSVGNLWVKTRTKRDANNWLERVSFSDKLGRAYLTAMDEGGNSWLVTETKFDSLGRTNQSANPYRVTATSVSGIPAAAALVSGKQWTTKTYDTLNRVLTVTTPDNAVVTTNYSGNQVLVIDQSGKKRMSESDALGRLKKVWEITPADTYTVNVSFPGQSFTTGYQTSYTYDTLNNLTQVSQNGQIRTFVYDSLKRLTSATNPESGTTTYTYDNNSNLITRADARPLTTTYTYDNLNRNTTVRYSSYPNGTSAVDRFYDNATLGKGRLYYAISYNTETNGTLTYNYDMISGYDAAGRPQSKSQNFLIFSGGSYQWKPYTTSVAYDLAGNVTSQTYPSGRTVSYSYNTVGRTMSFTGNLGDGVSRNYATSIQYTAAGQLTKETFGTTTPLYHRLNYNVRQQLFAVRVGTDIDMASDASVPGSNAAWNRGLLLWHYGNNDYANWGTSGTNNNGSVLRSHHYIPCTSGGNCGVYYSDYDYDSLNRLLKVTDYGHSTNVQQFDYDCWGNRTINQTYTTTSPDINKKLFSVNATNNRLSVPSGQSGTMMYDNVGNLIDDTYTNPGAGGVLAYDAENLMTSAVNNSHQYRYNADGRRVKRIIMGQGEFWMVYGISGELVAEYNANAAQNVPIKEYGYRGGKMLIIAEGNYPKWLIQDHLGSARMEIGFSGSLGTVVRHDYLPFGEELGGSVRTAPYGFGATTTRQKFTGYERDYETILDFAQARYYSSVQGRFTSVDPANAGANPNDPHSWNGYAYARSNPTIFTDPDGRKFVVCNPKGGGCSLVDDDDFYRERREYQTQGFEFTGNGDFYESGEIKYNGETQATYMQISIDDRARELSFEMRMASGDKRIIENAAANSILGAILSRFKGVKSPPRVRVSTILKITQMFGVLECMPCAKELLKLFRKKGINARVLKIEVDGHRTNLYSDTAKKTISESGNHWAIEVEGMVYDNIHKAGMPFNQWALDFHVMYPQTKRIFTDLTDTILKSK